MWTSPVLTGVLSLGLQAYNGNTALHVAASLQYRVTQLDAVRLLMRKGADPSTRNLENEQPVHLVPDGPVGEQVRAPEGKDVPVGIVLKHKSGGPAGTLQVASVGTCVSAVVIVALWSQLLCFQRKSETFKGVSVDPKCLEVRQSFLFFQDTNLGLN